MHVDRSEGTREERSEKLPVSLFRTALALCFYIVLLLLILLSGTVRNGFPPPVSHYWAPLREYGLLPLAIAGGVGGATRLLPPPRARFWEGGATGLIAAALAPLVLIDLLRSAHALTADQFWSILRDPLLQWILYPAVGAATEYLVSGRMARVRNVADRVVESENLNSQGRR